jgi:hypothetical protein
MMVNKYNIALLPISKSINVIKCAQFLSKISDQYQLGRNSLPHVTLCQFNVDDYYKIKRYAYNPETVISFIQNKQDVLEENKFNSRNNSALQDTTIFKFNPFVSKNSEIMDDKNSYIHSFKS